MGVSFNSKALTSSNLVDNNFMKFSAVTANTNAKEKKGREPFVFSLIHQQKKRIIIQMGCSIIKII